MNFINLDQNLSGLIERMTPPAVKASALDLYRHFTQRHDDAYERLLALQAREDKVHTVAALTTIGASVTALGMIATSTAPVVLPVATAVGLGTAAVMAARVLVHHARAYYAEEDMGRTRRILGENATEAVALAYERELHGGPLTRLYRRTKDLIVGHDLRAASLLSRIESTGVSGAVHRETVQRLLRESLTPAFGEYVQRNARAPHTMAARLMARLRELPDLDLTPVAAPRVRVPGLPRLGQTLMGLAPSVRMPSLLADLGMAAAATPPVPTTHYGSIAASESDRNFLQGLGVELGVYNGHDGTFPAKLDANALHQLDAYREDFPAELFALPDGRVDPTARLLDVELQQADPALLSGYRAYLRYTVGTDLGSAGAASGLAEVNREVHRRHAAQRVQATPARTADTPALEA
ncbi:MULTISPECIES: hypothetical protein [Cupriavidus]